MSQKACDTPTTRMNIRMVTYVYIQSSSSNSSMSYISGNTIKRLRALFIIVFIMRKVVNGKLRYFGWGTISKFIFHRRSIEELCIFYSSDPLNGISPWQLTPGNYTSEMNIIEALNNNDKIRRIIQFNFDEW